MELCQSWKYHEILCLCNEILCFGMQKKIKKSGAMKLNPLRNITFLEQMSHLWNTSKE